jgi:hypothetical protein
MQPPMARDRLAFATTASTSNRLTKKLPLLPLLPFTTTMANKLPVNSTEKLFRKKLQKRT